MNKLKFLTPKMYAYAPLLIAAVIGYAMALVIAVVIGLVFPSGLGVIQLSVVIFAGMGLTRYVLSELAFTVASGVYKAKTQADLKKQISGLESVLAHVAKQATAAAETAEGTGAYL